MILLVGYKKSGKYLYVFLNMIKIVLIGSGKLAFNFQKIFSRLVK